MTIKQKSMKRILIILGLIILLIVGGILIFSISASEDKPESSPGPAAEKLAQKIYSAVNKDAWDSLAVIRWTFRDHHHYTWDRRNNFVEVNWDDMRVLLNPDRVTGVAYKEELKLPQKESEEWVEKAFSKFCNDGFWMNAFTKLHDPGTKRGLHVTEEGDSALMVTYDTGGVTPGDSYLWLLDSNGLPKAYKMWVSIIPIGGIEFTWEDWDTLYNGALIAKNHKSEMLEVPITGIQAGSSLKAVGKDDNLFASLNNMAE